MSFLGLLSVLGTRSFKKLIFYKVRKKSSAKLFWGGHVTSCSNIYKI